MPKGGILILLEVGNREGEFFLATVPGDNAHPEEKALGSSRVTRVSPIIDAATGSRDQAGSGAETVGKHCFLACFP